MGLLALVALIAGVGLSLYNGNRKFPIVVLLGLYAIYVLISFR